MFLAFNLSGRQKETNKQMKNHFQNWISGITRREWFLNTERDD